MLKNNLVFIDTETTGLNPLVHEVIEISIIDYNGDVLFNSRIKPMNIENASPEALKVNGYNPDKWNNAPYLAVVLKEIVNTLTDKIIVGHNVNFDIDFVEANINRVLKLDKPLKFNYGKKLDTKCLAYEHLYDCGQRKFSLVELAKFFRFPVEGAHSSLIDATLCLMVFKKLYRAGWLKRLWWRVKKWMN